MTISRWMIRIALVGVTAWGTGCTGGAAANSDGGTTDPDGGTGGPDASVKACEPTGFAAGPTALALPALGSSLYDLSGYDNSCASAALWWSTIDINGDGNLDLVQTSSCTDSTIGTSHWVVYPGNGHGFGHNPSSFALPALGSALYTVSGYDNSCAGSALWWSTIDINGDGLLDLVQTSSCTDSTIGKTHWLVYPGSGSGFATQPTSFALPNLGSNLYTLSGYDNSCSGGVTWWSTIDLNGDGKLDLVQTSSCTDATVGKSHWAVYRGMDGGFATSPTSFALPDLGSNLYTLSGYDNSCTSGVMWWSTIDLNGDGKLDLVQTSSCTDATIGKSHWAVYAGTGSKFAASPTPFTLPDLGANLYTLSGYDNSCSGGVTWWSTIDLNGDGKLDLVQTSSCTDTTLGATHWDVYAKNASGFAASPTSFALPMLGKSIYTLSGYDNSCTSGTQWWSTVDLNGDGKLELVQSSSCSDSTLGTTHWDVYNLGCRK